MQSRNRKEVIKQNIAAQAADDECGIINAASLRTRRAAMTEPRSTSGRVADQTSILAASVSGRRISRPGSVTHRRLTVDRSADMTAAAHPTTRKQHTATSSTQPRDAAGKMQPDIGCRCLLFEAEAVGTQEPQVVAGELAKHHEAVWGAATRTHKRTLCQGKQLAFDRVRPQAQQLRYACDCAAHAVTAAWQIQQGMQRLEARREQLGAIAEQAGLLQDKHPQPVGSGPQQRLRRGVAWAGRSSVRRVSCWLALPCRLALCCHDACACCNTATLCPAPGIHQGGSSATPAG